MRLIYISISFVLLFFGLNIQAQEVLVSPDINIRNNIAYDVIGEIDDRIILFRDAGDEYFMETFDSEMSMVLSTSILFEREKVDIYNILGLDTVYQILYGYHDSDSIRIMSRRYNAKAELVDSISLHTVEKRLFKKYKHIHSEDESKTLLFTKGKKEKLEHILIDNKRHRLIAAREFEIKEVDLNEDFQFMELNNNGTSISYFDTDNYRYSAKDHKGHLVIIQPGAPNYQYIPLYFESNLTIDMEMIYNNENDHIVLGGLYSKTNNISSDGYFILNKHIDQIISGDRFRFERFEKEFIAEVIGTKKKKIETLNDFISKDILLRKDGGMILLFEAYKEFSRRSTYRSYSRRDASLYGDRGWVDYYNEDIVMVSLHPNGKEHWKQVLHKKQFSQDDDAVFSSFYIFKTPSRLRLIYNDEVAKNSTISEYLVDPIGRYERRSLLNTEYEDLKLRFNDGLQLTSRSLVVPSQQSYTLNLVKITY